MERWQFPYGLFYPPLMMFDGRRRSLQICSWFGWPLCVYRPWFSPLYWLACVRSLAKYLVHLTPSVSCVNKNGNMEWHPTYVAIFRSARHVHASISFAVFRQKYLFPRLTHDTSAVLVACVVDSVIQWSMTFYLPYFHFAHVWNRLPPGTELVWLWLNWVDGACSCQRNYLRWVVCKHPFSPSRPVSSIVVKLV